MLVNLDGQIERITYCNEENGFTIARLKVFGQRDLVTVVGNLMSPTPGAILKMEGEWSVHPKFGEQFKVVNYKTDVPATLYGIKKYLGSGLIKGIGPVMAGRIVKRFSKKTINIIEHNIEKLVEVDGIGKKRVAMIEKAWEEQKEIRDVMLFLQTHGVSSGYAVKIFREYGNNSVLVVTENPYRLAEDIYGIGFITADTIAEKLGFSKDSEQRIEAGILYVLHQLSDEGHVYYPYEELIKKSREILTVERDVVVDAIAAIAVNKKIVIEDLNSGIEKFAVNNKAVYLAKFYLCETRIAGMIKRLVFSPGCMRSIDIDSAVAWVQEQLSIQLAEKQIEAVAGSCENKMMIITGGPGTGKTTIINAILKIFSKITGRIMLAAPTGRAAKRMSETTGYGAKTIHRLLEYSFANGGFQKNEKKTLNCDLLIIDEASMIDTVIMYHLLKAIPPEATFILVGDVNQLPSVGAGNILNDIIGSGLVPVVKLNEIFRQARESRIIVNAHRINKGMMPYLISKDKKNDFYFIEQEDPERVLDIILRLVKDRVPSSFGFDSVNDIQVLSPMHRGVAGAANLNIKLQEALNSSGTGIIRGSRNFRVNDKVMQVRNNYDKNVFNGDIGRIIRVSTEDQEVTISFDGRRITYDFNDLDELVLAYAVSVHKSQGSEYPVVVIPVLTQHYMLLQRNLIYTAVTRGRRLVVIVGTKKAMAIAVKNDKTHRRYTYLKERLTPIKKGVKSCD
ncbi:exodeoxyribonuclease V alpha subunit [Desulfosarcina sp. BuS5]|uniref:SF1B family DNA helicase RecD2 n=1 Tax=Desulfosarcina sp. BuS5 TaxID=933262 RepID=UPI000480ADBD|nr:ATP-dependent RecD-like DNA helicase [Desulfosarcina sp. BuS5]WDN89060.1 exodeoxyribonuclease V alpha subunit [Desulfosarcina sp. BuS5]